VVKPVKKANNMASKFPVNVKEGIQLFLAVFTAIGILATGIGIYITRGDKINNSVTKQQLQEALKPQDTIIVLLKVNMENINKLNNDIKTLETSVVTHIRSDKSLPDEQKLDQILNLVQGISNNMKQQQILNSAKTTITKIPSK
jgi:hypothetical protein